MAWLWVAIIVVLIASAIHGWTTGRVKLVSWERQNLDAEIQRRLRECEQQINRQKNDLEQQVAKVTAELKARADHIDSLRQEFATGFVKGRRWLAEFIAESDRACDEQIASRLKLKRHPARKASEEVAAARAERRVYKERVKFLEYQLKSYEEYFPVLTDYREMILDEVVSLSDTANSIEALEDADPVLRFVPKAEFDQLTTSERNQRALDRYVNRPLNDAQIGRFYERYVGYMYERDGWDVEYYGIIKGFEDLGRDLVCKKGHEVLIIQTKCWSKKKVIHEKHLFQLFGSMQHYLMDTSDRLFPPDIVAWFYTTTKLSMLARQIAECLKIKVKEEYPLDKSYPMIKCNINQATREKIYHLPFDQQYDTAKIIPALGECYARSVAEAECFGFRRAWRHRRPNAGR